ncbi:ribbon-helix-helix DNA binding domain protein [Gordonia phage Eyre]|uniref:Antitoxin n=1 Tax=Gordonia phage Eyre TaxID=1887646 RepID=A0A1B3AZV9_9CAUD|nr:ribbon-helix-helix DNA binding domain protein [Gordonia phage Eyre]AOE44310.1 ribbon-helix-helix DNA binding domain protein [Gordonia phage Eyre]
MTEKFPNFADVDFEVTDDDLTPAEELAAAQEVEEVLPKFRQRAGLIPGGKSLSGGGKRSPVVQTVVAEKTKAELVRRAKAAGMSPSKFTRRVIEEYLAEHPA